MFAMQMHIKLCRKVSEYCIQLFTSDAAGVSIREYFAIRITTVNSFGKFLWIICRIGTIVNR